MQVDQIVELLGMYMSSSMIKLEQAVEKARPIVRNDELLDQAAAVIRKKVGVIEDLRNPATVSRRRFVPWYPGPMEGDSLWQRLKSYLIDEKGWDQGTVDVIDDASTKVLSQLPGPFEPEFSGRGLVLGYVQSGKTANFTGVISKAADVGFRLVIILSGMTNSLRQQTQERMESDLIERAKDRWLGWTDIHNDIGELPFNTEALLSEGEKRNLAVIKKNSYRMRRLIKMLEGTSEIVLRSCPVLVIDDECDQASVNSAKYDQERTRINDLLIKLLGILPKVAYIGYTATPYANVLVDPSTPDDLYPRDFIINLPRPEAYFGAERLFGRHMLESDLDDEGTDDGFDMIRIIPEAEEGELRPTRQNYKDWAIPITPSLRRATMYFWLASAVRRLRGQGSKPSSMLIHTTHYAAPHENSKEPINIFRNQVLEGLRATDPGLIAEFKSLWRDESLAVDSGQFGLEVLAFEDILPQLSDIVESTRLFVESGQSDARLEPFEGPAIVIGGNILARGLTIEGLVCSFFLRTTSMYDSLMQMGRWFGYRPGYEDLPRVWMSDEMESFFRDLATVEHEIRQDIDRYSDDGTCTPQDVSVRVRLHPKMEVTARAKMRHGEITGRRSFDSEVLQTIWYHAGDRAWLERNLRAGGNMLHAARQAVGEADGSNASGYVYRGVPWTIVNEFLEEYAIAETHRDFSTGEILDYVRQQNAFDSQPLMKWNIALVRSRSRAAAVHGAIGPHEAVPMVTRTAREFGVKSLANIGVLLTRSHATLDFDPDFTGPTASWNELKLARGPMSQGGVIRAVSEPLLLLYLIDRHSAPKSGGGSKKSGKRHALAAEADVLGAGFVFPSSEHVTPVQYIRAPVGPAYEDEVFDDQELLVEEELNAAESV